MEKNTKLYFADKLALSDEEKAKLKLAQNFQYIVEEGGVKIFALTDTLDTLIAKPVIQISKAEIEYQNLKSLPNMYYPCINDYMPLEVKTAYFLLKNLANKSVINSGNRIDLYDPNQKFLGWVDVIRGR